jgi:hypothetical protein
MKKSILALACFAISLTASADMCSSLQLAEGNILSIAYYKGKSGEERSFCYKLAQAVNAEDANGLDGLLMGSIQYCARGKNMNTKSLVKEVQVAMKQVNCISQIGQ